MMQTVSEIAALWDRILNKVKEEINDQRVYDSFFADSYIDSINGNTMIIAVNSGVAASVVNTKYFGLVHDCVLSTSGTEFELQFVDATKISKNEPIQPTKPQFFQNARLNPNFNFNTFVVGESNKEAHQASLVITRTPGRLYNPLLIYSDSGLGKTHLMNAIGNSIKEQYPQMKILYITAHDFLDEFAKVAQGYQKFDEFTDYFKTNVDVLLLDDVQYLVGKKVTLDLFFTIFQNLYLQEKQIVLTSDKHPSELEDLPDRLKTRFIQGLTISISTPDKQTSYSILKNKIELSNLNNIKFDDEVLYYYAEKFSSSVRELEEALNRLLFYTINIKPTNHVDLALGIEAISGLLKVQDDKSKLSEKKVISVTADYFNLTPAQLTGKIRTSQIALGRHVAMYLCRYLLDSSFDQIGAAFGGKDHSTVMNGVQRVERMLKSDAGLSKTISELKSKLKIN